jgi:putative hemolysin
MSRVQGAYLVILAVCIVGSGYFSGSETALVGIPRERVHQLDDTRRGRAVASLVADPERMLSTLLVANNFVNILAAAVATVLFIDLLGEQWGPWAATIVITSIILVVGEIGPKSLATRYPERYALFVAPTIWQLSKVLRPISRIFQEAAAIVFRPFGLRFADTGPGITEEDIRSLAVLGEAEGEIEAAEREIIHSLFRLSDRPVREVMTPRRDIITLDWPATATDLRHAVATTGHSRYPIIDGELDRLMGVLYAKDLLPLDGEPGESEIRRLLRQPEYVPESMPLLDVLQEMRRRRFAFAVVVDEHGGIEGVLTAKDLIAELVGELQDEYDPGTPSIVPTGPSTWVADGRLPVEEFAAGTGADVPEGEYSTVGGLYLSLAGKIPEEGESIEVDGVVMTVLTMDRRRIDRLNVERIMAPENA